MKSTIKSGVILFITLISCSFSKRKHPFSYNATGKDSIVLTDNYVRLCYGLDTKVDTSNVMEYAMQLLNASDYKGCLDLFNRSYLKMDTVRWHSGFYGLIIPDSNIQSYRTSLYKYNPLNYLSFRYNNFIGDLGNDEQAIIIQNSANVDNQDELFKLQYVEGDILRYDKLRISDTLVAKEAIKDIEVLQSQYPESKRLEYILATAYLVIGEEVKTKQIYNRLISQNYYALLCLKNLIYYLGDRNKLEEQRRYLSLFKRMFPNECLLVEQENQLPNEPFRNICKKCVEIGSQRDSIRANIFLAKYYFNHKDYELFDSVTNIYFSEHKYGESYDDLKVYEEKVYPDLKMRELFLLKQYSKMFKYQNFIHLEKYLILKDFKNYIKKLYYEYISTNTNTFEKFYKINF